MKILMVAPRFSPKSGGGGYVITNNLIKALEKRGHDVKMLTSDYEYELDNWKVMAFNTNITLMGFHITTDMDQWVKGYLSQVVYPDGDGVGQNECDVIHLQGCRTFQNIVVSHYARKYKIPYIVDAHGFPIQGSWLHKLVLKTFDFFFANKIVRGAKYCIAETEVGKQEYLRAGVKEERIKIIPCPYDLSIFDNLPQKGEFKKKHGLEGKHIVGFLGGLDRIKGLDFLVEAYGQLLKQYKYEDEPILVLAGTDMGFKSELDKLIDEWDISKHVIFTGYISGRDKLEYLVDCDVCVFPSRAEQGLPFAALEAIMCGNSIIVADGTGSAEDVRKMKCGVIVKFGNTKALDDAILMVLSDDMSYLNKRGQDYIYKNLSLEEKARDYERVYADIKGEYYSICR